MPPPEKSSKQDWREEISVQFRHHTAPGYQPCQHLRDQQNKGDTEVKEAFY